jgi:hypothetical protein
LSFTIKCNKCGAEQEFTNESKKYNDHISIEADIWCDWSGSTLESIDIDCENPTCNNGIKIKC